MRGSNAATKCPNNPRAAPVGSDKLGVHPSEEPEMKLPCAIIVLSLATAGWLAIFAVGVALLLVA